MSTKLKALLLLFVLIALGGAAFYIATKSKDETSSEDSSAAVLSGEEISLNLISRIGIPTSMQNRFNLAETATFNVVLSKLTANTYKGLSLIVQYEKANFDPGPNGIFTIPADKYQVTDIACTPISTAYACARKDFAPNGGAYFSEGEIVATVNLTAKALTTGTDTADVTVFPTGTPNSPAKYSWLLQPNNATDAGYFATSSNTVEKALKKLTIEDQCRGDYNRTKGPGTEIVDLDDLSKFAIKWGLTLTGNDIQYDIDNRGSSLNKLDIADLRVFALNYGLTTCAYKKSAALP